MQVDAEPRWPVWAAIAAFAGVRYVLPSALTWGPDWTMAVLLPSLVIPSVLARRSGNHMVNEILGYTIASLVTVDLIVSLSRLIVRLGEQREGPRELLVAAVGLWCANVIVFAVWYWHLDAGGPNERDRRAHHQTHAFLFPQMTLPDTRRWKPGFVDYFFLAFTTSTALSPTDTPVLSRWAKVMMIVQASISLATIAILAARAINIL